MKNSTKKNDTKRVVSIAMLGLIECAIFGLIFQDWVDHGWGEAAPVVKLIVVGLGVPPLYALSLIWFTIFIEDENKTTHF